MEGEPRFVFGPVPSRRLGQSLGVDPLPAKTCNWNCVYCQLGRTTRMKLGQERAEYFPKEEILQEVREVLAKHQPGEIDWVTFVGSGEPTLYSELGWLIRQVKTCSELPVAVITNGSLLYLPEVRAELMAADAVLPSLDAGEEELYRRINRALPELSFKRLLDGMTAFRESFPGALWVEVMLVRSLNDGEEALNRLADALRTVRPDQVHINLPTRPPAESWAKPPDPDGVERAVRILGKTAQVVRPAAGKFDLGNGQDLEQAVLHILTRHPMKESQLRNALSGYGAEDVLEKLLESGRVQVVERYGERFWTVSKGRYGKPVNEH